MKEKILTAILLLLATFWLLPGVANPKETMFVELNQTLSSKSAPADNTIEVAFSPGAGATELVVKAIDNSKKAILVAAYSFTSKPIAQALMAAHKRGVEVKVVVDKSQKSERYTSATFLVNMGIPTRVDSQHSIQHNKFMVIDDAHVETGSFNYTSAAEQRNAENAIVVWNNPKLAAIYANNWRVHWAHSEPYGARY